MGGAAPVVDAAGTSGWRRQRSVTSAGALRPQRRGARALVVAFPARLFRPVRVERGQRRRSRPRLSAPALVGSDLAFQAGKSGSATSSTPGARRVAVRRQPGGVCNGESTAVTPSRDDRVRPVRNGVTAVSIARRARRSRSHGTRARFARPPILVGGCSSPSTSPHAVRVEPEHGATVEQFGSVRSRTISRPRRSAKVSCSPLRRSVHAFAAAATTPSTPPPRPLSTPRAATTTTTPTAGRRRWRLAGVGDITLLVGVAAALLGIVTWRRRDDRSRGPQETPITTTEEPTFDAAPFPRRSIDGCTGARTATLAAVGVVGAIPLALSGAGPASAAALPTGRLPRQCSGIRRGQLGVSFASPSTAWTSAALDGSTFGEPLEDAGRVSWPRERLGVRTRRRQRHGLVAGEPPTPVRRTSSGAATSAHRRHHGHPGHRLGVGEIFVVADEWNGSTAVHVLSGSTSTPATSR